MVVTNRDDLAAQVRLLRSHGMTSLTWDRHRGHAASYDVMQNGFNYRIDELRSALGRAQLAKLDRNNARRRGLTALYWEKLTPLETLGWSLPFKKEFGSAVGSHGEREAGAGPVVPSCHLLPLVAPSAEVRQACAQAMREAGIQTSLHYPFIPSFSAFTASTGAGGDGEDLVASRGFCERVMTLPLFPGLTEAEVALVAGRAVEIASELC